MTTHRYPILLSLALLSVGAAAQVAMVMLAEIDVDAKPTGSILSLFPGKTGVDDLSVNDLAVLKSLYRLPLDRNARFHRGMLMQAIIAARLPVK